VADAPIRPEATLRASRDGLWTLLLRSRRSSRSFAVGNRAKQQPWLSRQERPTRHRARGCRLSRARPAGETRAVLRAHGRTPPRNTWALLGAWRPARCARAGDHAARRPGLRATDRRWPTELPGESCRKRAWRRRERRSNALGARVLERRVRRTWSCGPQARPRARVRERLLGARVLTPSQSLTGRFRGLCSVGRAR
jgi:hypothetical protein